VNLQKIPKKKAICVSNKEEEEKDVKEAQTTDLVRKKYLESYKFLDFDANSKLIYCKWCRDKGYTNSLAKGYQDLKRTRIDEHCNKNSEYALCIKQQLVLKGEKPSENQQTIENIMLKAKNSDCIDMIPIFRNIYFLSKEKIALYKSESIH